MRNILTTLAAVAAFSAPAFADTIEILTYYKPGGGTDQQIQIAKPLLEAQGHTVNVQYLKSCNDAVARLKEGSGNVLMYHLNGDYAPNDADAKCVISASDAGVYVAGISAESPLSICVAPNADVTRETLLTKPLKLGVAAGGAETWYVNRMLSTLNATNIEVERYRGGGAMRKGVMAGDVDLFFSTNVGLKKVKGYQGCLYSSMMNDPMGTPFIGGTDSSYPTIANANIIWSDSPDSVAAKAMRTALSDASYIETMRSMKMSVPAPADAPALITTYASYNK
jgi:hypothetical protein